MYCFYRDENDITRITDFNSEILNKQTVNIIGGRKGRSRSSSPRRSSLSSRSISPTSRFVTYVSRPYYYYRPVVVSYLTTKYKTKYDIFVEKIASARNHYMSAVNALTPVANIVNPAAAGANGPVVALAGVQVTHNGVVTQINNSLFSKQFLYPHITANLANGVNNAHLATITINPVAIGGITVDMINNFNNHMNLCRSALASLEPLDTTNTTTVLIDNDRDNQYRVVSNNFPYYTVLRKDGNGANQVKHILEINLVKMY